MREDDNNFSVECGHRSARRADWMKISGRGRMGGGGCEKGSETVMHEGAPTFEPLPNAKYACAYHKKTLNSIIVVKPTAGQ